MLSRLNKIIVIVQSVEQRWSLVELRLPEQLQDDTSLLSGSVCDYCSHTLPFSRANRTCSKRLFCALPRTSSLVDVSSIDESTGQTVGALIIGISFSRPRSPPSLKAIFLPNVTASTSR